MAGTLFLDVPPVTGCRVTSETVSDSMVITSVKVKHRPCDFVGKTYDIMYVSRSQMHMTATVSDSSELVPGARSPRVVAL